MRPISDGSESNRVEMKKFCEMKAPLNMLKFKLQLKSQKNDAFKVFSDELENVTTEQNKFFEKLEYQVAVAEAVDPVQVVCAFLFKKSWGLLGIGVVTSSSFYMYMHVYIYAYVCAHVIKCNTV